MFVQYFHTQWLSKLLFSQDDKKVYRKTPTSSRTGSKERDRKNAVPDQEPPKDETDTIAKFSKAVEILKSKSSEQDRSKSVSKNTNVSDTAVSLDMVKNKIHADVTAKIDFSASTPSAPVKKTYKKI